MWKILIGPQKHDLHQIQLSQYIHGQVMCIKFSITVYLMISRYTIKISIYVVIHSKYFWKLMEIQFIDKIISLGCVFGKLNPQKSHKNDQNYHYCPTGTGLLRHIYKKKYLPISANPYCNFVILVPDISGSKPLLTHILAQL